jgi:oligopeptide transport system permease protein
MRILLALLPIHLLVYLGLRQRELGEAANLASVFQGLLAYPTHLWQVITNGGLAQFLVGLPTTGVYFTLAALLAWPAILLLRRLPTGVRWLFGSLPGFFLLTLAIFVIFWLAAVFRFFTPLEPNQPWIIAVLTLALLLPPAARVAHYLELRRLEYAQADFTRTARSIGLSEARVQAKAARVALPEGVSLLAGEAFGLAVAVMLLEGLLQFPGLGLAVYNILASGGAVEGLNLGVQMPATQASGGLLLLLLMAGIYAVLVEWLARRLDPRMRGEG